MRNVLLGLLALILIAAVSCATTVKAQSADDHEGETVTTEEHHCLGVYACPMFCESFMTTDPEARCPACGMNVSMVEELYVCPDHPDEFSLDPKSVCVDDDDVSFVEVEQLYVCPMHPEEIYADPDARCGECGMKLEPIEMDPETCAHHNGEGENTSGSGSAHGGGCC